MRLIAKYSVALHSGPPVNRAQVPQVATIAAEHDKLARSIHIIASMPISASRHSDRARREDVVSRAKHFLQSESDRDLQAALGLRQSTLSRIHKR